LRYQAKALAKSPDPAQLRGTVATLANMLLRVSSRRCLKRYELK
jgi:hypothetical protein